MKKRAPWSLFILMFLIFGSCKNKKSEEIRIAAAANLHFAMSEIVELFEKEQGINCELITTSSGKLTAQILSGAPFDIFVSADLKYPEELFRSGLSIEGPKVYARGHLVLWCEKARENLSFETLKQEEIKHIAIANPQTAPYGKAAMEVLSSLDPRDELKSKLVYGESISQTNQFIFSGAADVGFTSLSTVLSQPVQGIGSWYPIDTSLYSPIYQGVVRLRRDVKKDKLTAEFEKFLFEEKARNIFDKFGYST